MPKKRKRGRQGRGRPHHLRSMAAAEQANGDDLTGALRAAVDSNEPLDLLALVSSLMAALEPREAPLVANEPGAPIEALTLDELVQSFIEVDERETAAALIVIAAMSPDDVLASRITRNLSGHRHSLPDWLGKLAAAEPTTAVAVTDPLGDAENIIIGVRLTDEDHLSIVVLIDHNLGGAVKDAFVLPTPIEDLLPRMRDIGGVDGLQVEPLGLAEARAKVGEALDTAAELELPIESDSWPACRSLLEWILRMLPEGGSRDDGGVEIDAQDLTDQFFASPFGAELDDGDRRALVQVLLSFGFGDGRGDPLRWSPATVEMLLLDFVPRAILAEPRLLAQLPSLLRAFIGFSHSQRGIPANLTEQTQQAVDQFAPEYAILTTSPIRIGPTALLSAQGARTDLDPADADYLEDIDDLDLADIMLESLRRAVGGETALASLTDQPLPDEDFAWAGIPDDIRPTIREVLEWCDRCCSELLDTEYRTAARRFLARAAQGDPRVFRRKARPDTAAAAICWVLGKANQLFTNRYGDMTARELNAYFGVSSSSQRAGVLLRANGIEDQHYGDISLGTPDLLVSSRRSRIISLREQYLAMR